MYFAIAKPIAKPAITAIIISVLFIISPICKKKPTLGRSFVQTPKNKFRANKLLKDPIKYKAYFYNLNSPFSNNLTLSLSKIITNVGSNVYILKNVFLI
jgi:hypothetical protein